jgi:1-acyl-sn-glycerol-3-phosphate acyltransferase
MPPVPARERMTPMYRVAMVTATPLLRWWGRLEVTGLEHLPLEGPLLIAGNHDSFWDPVAIGIAGSPRRQIRALAKAQLWDVKVLAPILNGMGQIPIERGKGDRRALDRAVEALEQGACIGVFLEGTRSRGRALRARSGFGRLAERVPQAAVVSCAVTGTTDVLRFPKRPRIRVAFFPPAGGGRIEGEPAAELGGRLLEEIRARAPVVTAGRRQRAV